jgi:N-acetylglucosaminyl-diphospho-decaprenol L-rhamnosyltransferase
MVSVLIVTYRSESHILPCLDSLPWADGGIDVCVVDNGPSAETRTRIEAFRRQSAVHRVRVIPGREPRSYAAAVNLGLHSCRGEWICLLGPDTRMGADGLERMTRFLKRNPGVGVVAPRLTDAAGRTIPSCRRFPGFRDVLREMSGLPRLWPSRFTPRWKMPDFGHDRPADVDQPEATCLLLRRRVLDEVGPMDERFPLFFNDVDWCRRIRTSGWRIVYLPEAIVAHVRGASVNREPALKIWRSHQGFYRYFAKHRGSTLERLALPVLGWLLILTAVLRTGLIPLHSNPRKDK